MGPRGWRGCNLRTTIEKIIRRAGLSPWPRMFHNMRASRETELTERFPVHVVTAWLGNTPEIARKHYLQVTDDHFAKAIRGGAESGAPKAQNAAQHVHADSRTNPQEKTQAPGDARACATSCDSTRSDAMDSSGPYWTRTSDLRRVKLAKVWPKTASFPGVFHTLPPQKNYRKQSHGILRNHGK